MKNDFLKILACPGCNSAVQYHPQKNRLMCTACEADYPIGEEIPVVSLPA